MTRAFDVAVLGATGLVGQHLIEILEQRDFPVNKLYPLASARSAGGKVTFKGKEITVLNAEEFDWSQVQLGFFSAGGSVSAKFAPMAAEAGCVVIDNTSHYRYEHDIPLVVPEVNAHALADFRNRNIIANPNCSTIQMMVALKPIQDAV
ncbi:MAG: aspartate-semialdehyde dehydrogenase, partial [Paraglaciecola sp.]